MKRLNTSGVIDPLLIPLILTTVMLLGAGSFAIWAFLGRQDYKNHTDQKVAAAVEVAKKETAAAKDNEFIEKEKLPLKDYNGPADYGSVVIKYPKTWSAYVDEKDAGLTPIDGYFHKIFVPGTQSNANFALRLQVVQADYANELHRYESNIKSGKLKAVPYVPAKVQSATGVRLSGDIEPTRKGTLVMVPLRDKVLKLWTYGDEFAADFDNIILLNYSFQP